ncbi:MAG: response regulator [Planctomycetota bacterium]
MTRHRILIVEDEMIVQMHLQRVVGQLGHEVVGTAATTGEALAVAERTPPELVLMDIHLADGCDGVDTARQLSDRWDCAVVFLTAYADPETVGRSTPVGAAGYLVKPFTSAQVGAAITTALANREHLMRSKSRERSLASALGSMSDAIFVTDEVGRITFASPRASDLTGWTAADAGGRNLREVVQTTSDRDEQIVEAAVTKALGGERTESIPNLEFRTRQGRERVADFGVEPVLDEEQRKIGLIAVLRNHAGGHEPERTPTRVRERFGERTRILVYSHDTLGLGHLRRSLVLLRALCANHPGLSALLVTGSPVAHRYPLPPGSDYVKLPAVRKTSPEQYEARSLSGSDIRTLRRNLILRTVRDYDPNVLLVDHSPLGSSQELLPTLEWLNERGGCTRILGLRDIIDDPQTVIENWNGSGIYGALSGLYDHLVVYGSREVYDPVAQYRFPPDVAAKTRFVHYVCDHAAGEARDAGPAGGPTVVAVAIGGGDGGGDTVVVPFLEMMRQRRKEIDFRAEILTGPLLPADEEARFRELARDLPVTLRSFVPSVADLYHRADVVVSTAGYNTVADQMAHSRRGVLVPRVLYRQEQMIRASRMQELGLATCLPPESATPDAFFEAIRRARENPDEPFTRARALGSPPLDGAECFSRFCGELLVHGR